MAYSQVRDQISGAIRSDQIRKDDGAFIPASPENSLWLEYQQWLADGNFPSPAPAWTPPPRSALGSALRDALKAKGWDGAWQTALANQSEDTRDWWSSGYRDLIPITATKLARIAKSAGVDLAALYDAVKVG